MKSSRDDRTIAVLCASLRSIYHQMPDVEVYDERRDARTFGGGMPVVAHPPCRAWSAFCAHQAKPLPGEKDLGLWCCERLRECGGVLEHPAHSRLFEAAGLPLPGSSDGELWSIAVDQAWWGYRQKKATWFCFAKVPASAVCVPFVLRNSAGDKRTWQRMSRHQRAATCRELAEWLVSVARASE